MLRKLLQLLILFVLLPLSVYARDLGMQEIQQLYSDGVLKNYMDLNAIAKDLHLGSKLYKRGNKFTEFYGRYLYQVALYDHNSVRWSIYLDAETGEVVKNMID